jgi:NitT/TauT family transport system substrate-binding protein
VTGRRGAARRAALALLGLALVASGWSCAKPATDAQPVRIAVSRYFANSPLFIARDEGFFADEGLTVEFVEAPGSASQLVPALVQGRIDVISSAVSVGILNAIGLGAKVRLVADRGIYDPRACSATALVARRVPEGRALSAEDVRGRRFAVSGPTSGTVYFLDVLLDSLGLRPDEVSSTQVPAIATLDALENGGIDFVSAIEPQLTVLLAAGNHIAIPYERVLPGFQSGALVFGPRLLSRDRDAGRRFIRAYLRAVRQYNQGKTEHNLDVLSRATGLDRPTLERMCWPPLREDGRLSLEGLKAYEEWAHRKGYMEHVIPVERLWDAELVQSAAAELASSPAPQP